MQKLLHLSVHEIVGFMWIKIYTAEHFVSEASFDDVEISV
jgi:hypothetical protein